MQFYEKMLGVIGLIGTTMSLASLPALAQHDHKEPASASMQGVVAFANGGAASAQTDFLLGLAQLHNFQYDAAAGSFRRAQSLDAGFAMAYWGEAMTYNHPIWAQQNLARARAVLAKLGDTPAARFAKTRTERERAYLATLDVLYGDGEKFDRDRRYALAMERLHAKYPDDIDATCFYALALLGTSHAGRDIPTYMQAAALMQPIFETHPQHPGAAHYLIHSVDDAAHAPLGLRAANAYSKIAPDSAHAQHMTSHIYLALGMWAETAAANEASIRVSGRAMKAANPSRPFSGCGHAMTWLHYAYLQQGRVRRATQLVERCAEELRARPMNAEGADQLDYDSTTAGTVHEMRSRQLIDANDWSGAVATLDAATLELALPDYVSNFVASYGAARAGKVDAATASMTRAMQAATRLNAAAAEYGIPAEHPQRRVPAIEIDELRGLVSLAKGNKEEGMDFLTKAAVAERELPMDFGPPSLHKPANELLGEVLLDAGRTAEARDAFEHAQRVGPGRVQSLNGLAQCATKLNDAELAASVTARLTQIKAGAGSDMEQGNRE
jgi:tetratricopeptide (TPR) repeat protein